MTKDELQLRIAQINNEMIQTKANYAKLEGHLGEAQHWLTELINKEVEAAINEGGSENPAPEDAPLPEALPEQEPQPESVPQENPDEQVEHQAEEQAA